jgi:SAM-dependent methyltransferase
VTEDEKGFSYQWENGEVMKRLNVGCGTDVREGWVNVDACFLKGVDQVVNLDHYPWPFNTEEFDSILCKSVIEHLEDFPRAMKELHRITRKGGTIEITVPHYTSTDAYGDPTHQRIFSSLTFLFFKKKHDREYYFDFLFDDVKVKIKFLKKPVFFYNPLLELLVNINDNTRLYYETSPLSVFPAQSLLIRIRK